MKFRKCVAVVMALILWWPALIWAQNDQASIRQLQERLQELGFYDGPIDGIYGAQTADAVREYQRAEGLAVTGTLTPETREALLKAEKPAERAEAALASGAVGTAAGATLGAIAGSAAVGAAIGGPIGLAAGLLGASLWSQLKDRF